MRRSMLSFGVMAPNERRGIVPLIAAAAGAGAIRTAFGAISANQQKQRNKGYIGAAYRQASSRLDIGQAETRQGTAESMNARGMGGSSAIRSALSAAPTDLAEQSSANLTREFGFERSDLDNSYARAMDENKAGALNAELGSLASGVQTAENVYGAGKDLSALKNAPAGGGSAIRQAFRTGIDDPANAWGGIHPVDPLGAPGSSWNRGTVVGQGQPNSAFNVG